MNRLRTLMFPLALAIILGGLSAWLDRISEVTFEEVKLDSATPQYSIQTMQAKRYDKQGWLVEQLTAKKAWQLPNQKDIFLAAAHLNVLQQGQLQYQVDSEKAQYNLDKKWLELVNEVSLVKPATASSPATKISTNHLLIDTQMQTAKTQATVHFTYGISHGSADGLFYDHKNGQLNLNSNVKAMIYDFKPKN